MENMYIYRYIAQPDDVITPRAAYTNIIRVSEKIDLVKGTAKSNEPK
jgi:hypothetical protein